MKKEMYVAECPKCKAIYKGDANYFRFDIKEKCFDGKTQLVNYRLEGDDYDAWANETAMRAVDVPEFLLQYPNAKRVAG